MASSRNKPSAAPVFTSLEQCDAALLEIIEINRRNKGIEDKMNAEIEVIKTAAATEMKE